MTDRQTNDVRMRGFARRTPVDEAKAWLNQTTDSLVGRPATRTSLDGASLDGVSLDGVSLDDASGRILANDVVAAVDVPQFPRGMMDGYAVQAADTTGATSYNQLRLRIIGEVLPGQRFDGRVQAGEAVRIMTGARMPEGADAVVPVEKTEVENTEVDGSSVLVTDAIAPGKHVGRVGEDIAKGQTVLSRGRVLRPQDLGILSSVGVSQLDVYPMVRVRIVVTGNELLPPGSIPVGEQITDANSPMLRALIERDGGEVVHPGIIPDDVEAIRSALHDDADVIIVAGGSSVGQEDFAPQIVSADGELAIHGIAMRPSSPTGLGKIDGRLVFLLPGNPVSCLCAYDFFAGPSIRRMSGRGESDFPYRSMVGQLTRKLVSVVGRVDYARVRLTESGVEPIAISGASLLSSTTKADGFVIVPEDSEGLNEGADIRVHLYDQ